MFIILHLLINWFKYISYTETQTHQFFYAKSSNSGFLTQEKVHLKLDIFETTSNSEDGRWKVIKVSMKLGVKKEGVTQETMR